MIFNLYLDFFIDIFNPDLREIVCSNALPYTSTYNITNKISRKGTESGPHYTMDIHLFSFKSCDVASCEFYYYYWDVGLECVYYITYICYAFQDGQESYV